ncbi:MAG: oxidoreductase, partial [Bacteroidetes bacterium]|nr:oxidoreductase [Fibrella sp.]
MTTLFETIIDSITSEGYGVLDNFLTADEVLALATQLRHRQAAGQFRAAGVGQGQATVEKQIRGDAIFWLDETDQTIEETVFLNRIDAFRQYVNQTCFLGLREVEFHYALYPAGAGYQRHLDQFRATSRRKLSLVCY